MHTIQVVTIGGGTGSFTVLSGLKKHPNLDITAIVAMSDDGGSTGKLRDEYGVLPPGDVRQCLVALSEASEELRTLFGYRFSGGSMHGQNLGNIIISGAEKAAGSFEEGLALVHKILAVHGEVVPVTLGKAELAVELGNGRIIRGQRMIEDFFMLSRFGVRRVFYHTAMPANPRALQAIREADLIVVGPGSIYDSLIPNFIAEGVQAVLRKSKARKVFVCNLMNKYGDTDDFTVDMHVAEVEKYAGEGVFDFVIYNTKTPAPELLRRYKEEGKPVTLGKGNRKKAERSYVLVGANILADRVYKPQRASRKNADLIRRTLIRHDPDTLARVILGILDK